MRPWPTPQWSQPLDGGIDPVGPLFWRRALVRLQWSPPLGGGTTVWTDDQRCPAQRLAMEPAGERRDDFGLLDTSEVFLSTPQWRLPVSGGITSLFLPAHIRAQLPQWRPAMSGRTTPLFHTSGVSLPPPQWRPLLGGGTTRWCHGCAARDARGAAMEPASERRDDRSIPLRLQRAGPVAAMEPRR